MNFKKSTLSIPNIEKREMDYIKEVYKRRVQSEIDSYKDSNHNGKKDTIRVQNILMLDKISI